MPILTTATISRKKLQEIINFGRKNKLITPKQATDLTTSVNKNSNIAKSNSLTPAETRKIKQIDLKADELHELIMIQEKRIQHEQKGPLTFRKAMPYAGILLSILTLYFFLPAAIASVVTIGTAAIGIGLVLTVATFGYFACLTIAFASFYGLSLSPSRSTLEHTLATLKEFDLDVTHFTPTPQILLDENSSENQPKSQKMPHSPSLEFFSVASTSQDVDSFSKSENTTQFKN